jgi:hypothetical protein
MDLPVNDDELSTIIGSLPESELRERLTLVAQVRNENPGGPFKRVLREEHGMVI